MPQFEVGDRVERIDSLLPAQMRIGTVIRVISDKVGAQDTFSQYEVNFSNIMLDVFFEPQLRLVKTSEDSNESPQTA